MATDPDQTTDTGDPYAHAPPLNHARFIAMADRLAQKSSAWAADTAQSIEWGHDAPTDPIPREMMDRYLTEMRRGLDHMDKQVKDVTNGK